MYSFESSYGHHQPHIPNIPMSMPMGGGGHQHHYMTLQPPVQICQMRQPIPQQEVPVPVQKETQSQKEWKKAEKYYAKLAKMEAQEKKKKRNKIADEKTWKRNIAKKARNEGKAYESANGKTQKKERSLGPSCGCQKKCMETIGMDNCKAIFEAYYGMGEWNRQTAYIANLVQAVPVKRRRPPRKKKDKDGNIINSSNKDKKSDEVDNDSDDENLTCPDHGPSCTGNCQQDDGDEDDPDSPGFSDSMECDVLIKEDYADINDSTVDNLVSELKKKQKKEKEQKMFANSRVKEIFEYYIHFKGKKIRVCKKAWLNIHGVNDRRVYYAVKNKINDFGVVELDRRGKHANLYRKLPPISSQLAIEHIKMFPRKTFYNPKAKNPDKRKVSSGLTMREMYEMYLEWMNATHHGVTPVAWPTYQKFKIKYFGKLT